MMMMWTCWRFVAVLMLLVVFSHTGGYAADIRKILSGMTIAQKAAQMTQLDINLFMLPNKADLDEVKLAQTLAKYPIGSLLNSPFSGGSLPTSGVLQYGWTADQWRWIITRIQTINAQTPSNVPILYGLDSIHGASYVYNATFFPHQLGAAATFNRDLVLVQGAITAKDTRISGVPWLFSPILGIATQPIWPRVYETFGEDPYLAAEMGIAIITGIQGGVVANLSTAVTGAATMKHFVGYPTPLSGQDRTASWIPDRLLWQYYVPPFRAAVQRAHVATTMESYNELNGVPVVSSHQYLVELLRNEIGFNGTLVTDYAEISNLVDWHKITDSYINAAKIVLNRTSVDLSMDAMNIRFPDNVVSLVTDGTIPESRLDESVARILQLKNDLGLLDNGGMPPADPSRVLIQSVGSATDRASALQSCRESITLLENDGTLPIAPKGKSILLTGPSANSLAYQNGGWTLHWQGANSDLEFPYGTTILQGIQNLIDPTTRFQYLPGCDINGNYTTPQLAELLEAAQLADVVVAAFGEINYTEKPGNIQDLNLPVGQQAVLRALISSGRPVVVVLVSGRPRLLQGSTDGARAVMWAYLPGSEGGQAIAEILFGITNPSGRLPITYPRLAGDTLTPYWHKPSSEDTYLPQWPFGHGLSYTTFTYSALTLSTTTVGPQDTVTVTVTVTNSGPFDGSEAVLLFLSTQYREVTPEVKLLKGFTKLHLSKGQSEIVSFTLVPWTDFSFYGLATDQPTLVLESGLFTVAVAALAAPFTLVVPPSIVQSDTTVNACVTSDAAWFKGTIVGSLVVGCCIGTGCTVFAQRYIEGKDRRRERARQLAQGGGALTATAARNDIGVMYATSPTPLGGASGSRSRGTAYELVASGEE